MLSNFQKFRYSKTIPIYIVLVASWLVSGCDQKNQSPAKQPYNPTLNSIRQHKCPEWFKDAKFGMFIDWGIYSVPGWAPMKEKGAMYPDWYLHNMYILDEWKTYHNKTWGKDFERDDFIPKFTADKFNPDSLIKLAAETGMKYVIPFCKHHDGFCLWPSSYTDRNAKDMGPKKDLVRPITEACRQNNLKFGFYFSIEEWEYPIKKENGDLKVRLWEYPNKEKKFVPYDEERFGGKMTGKKPVEDFYDDYIIPQAKEFIDLYDPDILWFDGEWDTPLEETQTPEITSYFYNQAHGRKKVVVNDRLGRDTRFKTGDFFTSEYHSLDTEQPKLVHKWEECRGISQSFGYNWQDTEENVISTREFIDMFVRIVSENGNLMLIVNLDGKGALPNIQKKRMKEIGKWLDVNGEAIYFTRPWLVSHEGEDLRFTQSKNGEYVYAICSDYSAGEISIKSVYLDEQAEVTLLGTGKSLQWSKERGKIVVKIPQSLEKPSKHAYVLKLEMS